MAAVSVGTALVRFSGVCFAEECWSLSPGQSVAVCHNLFPVRWLLGER